MLLIVHEPFGFQEHAAGFAGWQGRRLLVDDSATLISPHASRTAQNQPRPSRQRTQHASQTLNVDLAVGGRGGVVKANAPEHGVDFGQIADDCVGHVGHNWPDTHRSKLRGLRVGASNSIHARSVRHPASGHSHAQGPAPHDQPSGRTEACCRNCWQGGYHPSSAPGLWLAPADTCDSSHEQSTI